MIMLDMLRRLFCNIRPFDVLMLIVEVLVLLLIAYEVGSGIWKRLRHRRRLRRVREFLSQGQALDREVPMNTSAGSAPATTIEEWVRGVREWADATNKLLLRYSREASVSFLLSTGANPAHSLKWASISWDAKQTYEDLQERLINLRIIMENPDVYL